VSWFRISLVVLCLSPGVAAAASDPGGGLRALVSTPMNVLGDLTGGAGLIAAAALATGGDLVSLIDANRASRPVLGGAFSEGIRRVAMGVSQLSTGALEGLRGEDIERLPEAAATYLTADPFVGRFHTFADGIAAAGLALPDIVYGPAVGVLRLIGAQTQAERLEAWRADARDRALGPEPIPVPSS